MGKKNSLITFYDLVNQNSNIHKPIIKTEDMDYARELRGDRHNISIIKYKGFKRLAHGRTTLVIKDVSN